MTAYGALGQYQVDEYAHYKGPLGEEREKWEEKVFEFSILGKDIDIHIQEAQNTKQKESKETHTETHYI